MGTSETAATLRVTESTVSPREGDGVERHAEWGRLSVPARHAQPARDAIELAVVRLESTATSAGDPIVFLMGGPGIPASVMAQVPYTLSY
jgi:hypothetical protein